MAERDDSKGWHWSQRYIEAVKAAESIRQSDLDRKERQNRDPATDVRDAARAMLDALRQYDEDDDTNA